MGEINLIVLSVNKEYEEKLRRPLEEKGHSVRYLKTAHGPRRENIVETKTKNFFPLFLIWLIGRYFLVNSIVTLRAVKNIRELTRAEAILIGDKAESGFLTAWLMSRSLNIPLIYITHVSPTISLLETFEAFEKGSMGARLIEEMDRQMQRRADKLLVFSHALKEYLSDKFNIPKEKYSVMRLGLKEDNVQNAERGEEKDADVIYWGNFLAHHGMETIVRSAKYLDDVKITFIGKGGPGKKREKIIRIAKEEGIENVEFTGFISSEELKSYIESSKIAIGPMSSDKQNRFTIGTKVGEACLLETPLITADVPSVREIFEDGENIILCPPDDPEKLAKKIREYLNKPEERKKIGGNAREVYEKHFRTEARAEKFLEAYREVKDSYHKE